MQWTYHKEWSFASNYFIFFGNFVSVYEPFIKTLLDAPAIQMSVFSYFL